MKTAFATYAAQARADGHPDLARRLLAEQRACGHLIKACLSRNLTVSVYDGGDWCLIRSTNLQAIMHALASTDSDVVLARHPLTNATARFVLVYGNSGAEVIADYTDNAMGNSIWESISAKLDALQG